MVGVFSCLAYESLKKIADYKKVHVPHSLQIYLNQNVYFKLWKILSIYILIKLIVWLFKVPCYIIIILHFAFVETRNISAASPGRRVLPSKKSNTTTPNKMVGRSVSNIDTRAAERARLRRRSQTEGISQTSQASDVRQRPTRSASKVVHRGYMSQRKS
jgi:hypothetical protein